MGGGGFAAGRRFHARWSGPVTGAPAAPSRRPQGAGTRHWEGGAGGGQSPGSPPSLTEPAAAPAGDLPSRSPPGSHPFR